MGYIIKKDLPGFLIFPGIAVAALMLLRIFIGNRPYASVVIISGLAIFMLTIATIFSAEQYEEKHKGYDFLAVLPIKNVEIVAAKFALSFTTILAFTLFLWVYFQLLSFTSDEQLLIRSYLLLMACGSVLLSGIMYVGIFAISYTKFLIVVASFITALGFVPILIMRNNRERMPELIENTINWLTQIDWVLMIPLVLMASAGLMALAVLAKSPR